MQEFTHLDLLELTEKEEELKAFLSDETKKMFSPKKQTIQNILNYSKALSIRKSRNIDFIEMVLN